METKVTQKFNPQKVYNQNIKYIASFPGLHHSELQNFEVEES